MFHVADRHKAHRTLVRPGRGINKLSIHCIVTKVQYTFSFKRAFGPPNGKRPIRIRCPIWAPIRVESRLSSLATKTDSCFDANKSGKNEATYSPLSSSKTGRQVNAYGRDGMHSEFAILGISNSMRILSASDSDRVYPFARSQVMRTQVMRIGLCVSPCQGCGDPGSLRNSQVIS
ncbi:hypothetical protein HPP92_007214 [Vanilla planifolia]|uniref:Uncharacterized protein n=1 Tax=Vanilla planifolia TaxID=51239 RepID=A0A835RLH4_VANPL|nr:hypothetical protein HPP92_007214 [Vanilla planifolia]